MQNLDQLEDVYEKAYETIIGNCDTHLFLGSNSQKTVEYFSKALGEKTITRDNISVNKDREDWKQGKSESDQIMGRTLMTPDELRRMDMDQCIIYEKGLKPIKANKYYYFKYPEGKLVNKYKSDHNEVQVERGIWRKYNPYNPYDEDSENGESGKNDVSLESLDDLFETDEGIADTNVDTIDKPKHAEASMTDMEEIDLNSLNNEDNNMDEKRKAEIIDIQKELEAKFDELFGSMDSDDE